MPSQKPRLNLTLPDDLNDRIVRLSELTGKSKSFLVVEMLHIYSPILEQTILALEQIKDNKENGKEIAKKFGIDMLAEANIVLGEFSKEIKNYD